MFSSPGEETVNIVRIPVLKGDDRNPGGHFKEKPVGDYLMKPTCFEMISYCSSFFWLYSTFFSSK
mgnify:FL=1